MSDISRFTHIPVKALGPSSRKILARHLNPPKSTMSQEGICQDKDGLAELMNYQHDDIRNFALKEDFTLCLLEDWSTKQGSTIATLWSYLQQMERHDILEDSLLCKTIERDVERFKHAQELDQASFSGQPLQVAEVESSDQLKAHTVNDHHADEFKNITIGEVRTGKPEFFDAFVCYTSEDFPFVRQMISNLERVHGLKMCILNRDLMPGTSKYTVVAKLIEERCKKMIIVLSPDYLRSAECDFQTKFAHSLSPGSRSKKLIPVLIKHPCVPPSILRHITPVDYTKCDLVEWFWERLAKSLEENSYGQEDDVFSMALGPPALPMEEGMLPIHKGENSSFLSQQSCVCLPPPYSSGLTPSSSQTSMHSMTSSSSRTSYTSPCTMDTEESEPPEPNMFMPPPSTSSKKKRSKLNLFSKNK